MLPKSEASKHCANGLWAAIYFCRDYLNITGKNTWTPPNWCMSQLININLQGLNMCSVVNTMVGFSLSTMNSHLCYEVTDPTFSPQIIRTRGLTQILASVTARHISFTSQYISIFIHISSGNIDGSNPKTGSMSLHIHHTKYVQPQQNPDINTHLRMVRITQVQ